MRRFRTPLPLYQINFDFVPSEPRSHFIFRILNNVPSSHRREHSCFCRYSCCPFHNY